MVRNVAQLVKRVWLAGIRGHLNTRCRPPGSSRKRYRPQLEELESRTTPASLITDFTQGANGDALHSPPLSDITWLNGILNPNNSEYFEGVSTLQRIFFNNIATTTGNVHTLTFSHDAVKGDAHAYDFLTSWDQALLATNEIAPGTLVNPNTDSSDADTLIEAVEPGSSSPANFTTATTALRGGSFFYDVEIPDNLGSILGDDVAARIAAYEAEFNSNRTLRIWGNAAITSASLVFTGYSGSSGNEEANYTLTWTSASSQILIEFAGHLAMGSDFTLPGVGYGEGKGAGSISGGPYHISLGELDDASLGNQDNQIQANAVGLPPDYTIVKTGDALSKIGDPTSYTITITNTGGPALYPQSISDTLAGTLSAGTFSESGTNNNILDPDETWTLTYNALIPQGASDPFENTVTAIFDTQSNLAGIEVARTDTHSVNLFQPFIDVVKEVVSAPPTVVAGSVIHFRITINDGATSSDSPDLVPVSIVDTKYGTIDASDFTESGLNDNKLQEDEVWTFVYDYTVLASDVPSFTNTVNVLFKPENFPNELRDSSTVSLAVDVPDFTIVKTGDDLSKIGDQTSFTVTITNTGTAELYPQSISDTLAGTLSAGDFTEGGPTPIDDNILQTGEVWTRTYSLPIPLGAADPFVNTVTAIFDTQADLLGFEVTRSDDHSVNLFQPDIDVLKSADRTTAAIGDTITYTYVVTRGSSSADTPALANVVLTDDKVATISGPSGDDGDNLLEATETWTYTASHVVVAGDPDSYVNTGTVHANPLDFPNDLSDVSSWTVNLFQPGITVVKTGDALSKIGDEVTYTYVVTNTGSTDSPGLENVLLTDDKVATIPGPSGDDGDNVLELGETWTYTATTTIPVGASDPYINVATVAADAVGSVATVSDTDDHSVNLFQPDIHVLKSADRTTAAIGDTITYTYVVTRGSSSADTPALANVLLTDNLLGTITNKSDDGHDGDNLLEVGETWTYTASHVVAAGDPDTYTNTATVHANPLDFPNDLSDVSSWTVNLFQPGITVVKTGDELSKIGDEVTYTYVVTNTGSTDSPGLENVLLTDDKLGTISNPVKSGDSDNLLELGETWTYTATTIIPDGASDPYINVATVTAKAVNSVATVSDTDDHSVNLFQPDIDVLKEVVNAPTTVVAGSTVRFRITINDGNTSSDSPDLVPDAIFDNKYGTILASQFTESMVDDNKLQEDEVWTFVYDYTVLASDFPSFTNTVNVLFKPEGFPNELRDTSRVSLAVELPVEEGRMTGGGSVFLQSGDTGGPVGTRVTHGFQIHCSPLATNNRLEINWGKPNNHFHLSNLIPESIICRDTGIVQAPPNAPIDTFEADGVGRFSGTVGGIKYHNVYAEIHFLFTDGGPEKGEPGLYDTAQYEIRIDTDGNGVVDTTVLDNFGGDPTTDRLDRGNHQAHDEIKRFTSAITQFLSQIEQKLNQLDNPNLNPSQVRRYTEELLDLFAQLNAAVATTTTTTTTTATTTTSTSSTSTSLEALWFPPDDGGLVLNGVMVG